MRICNYGCEQEAKHQFKNGKWSCCEECHYKYGHKSGTECSTGNLANKICLDKK
jgi:hypothetical protein